MESFALWSWDEIVAATRGELRGDRFTARGVSIDSRSIAFGELFVAIQGVSMDGHAFAGAALRKGAAAALVSRVTDDFPPGSSLVVVEDTQTALERLGIAARQRMGGRVIAVTGSVGKTGTKEMLAHVLSQQGITHASTGSFNNLWGVPLSLARMAPDCRFGVFEIGMNHAGEITPLTRMVRPHIAIITTVEPVHLEFFPSVEAIADAKSEIFLGLEPGGVAIVYRDNPHFARMAEAAHKVGARLVGFGEHAEADVRLKSVSLHATCSCVAADVHGVPVTYKIGLPGRHLVMNSLAVLAAAEAARADIARICLAFADLKAPKGRGLRHRLAVRGGECDLIDDSYNASPVSIRAALDTLGRTKPADKGRRIAVFSDMRELGAAAEDLHRGLAPDVEKAGVDILFSAGPLMKHLHDSVPEKIRGAHAADTEQLWPMVRDALRPGDVVLVKGSLGSKASLVVERLLHPPVPQSATQKIANGRS